MHTLKSKRILVAPLDWGLGHATRCVPVIRALRAAGAEVLLAAGGRPYHFLKQEFPGLELIDLPGYDITYPKRGSLALHFALAAPRIMRLIGREQELVQQIVAEKKIDVVISDNRFGLYTKRARCIYITHQLNIKAPAGQGFINRLHRRYIERYDEVWVPDFAGDKNLSGELSHGGYAASQVHYIGPLTRFGNPALPASAFDHEVLALLSGPEPQRSLFEEKLLPQLIALGKKTLLVRGMTEAAGSSSPAPHIRVVNSLPSPELEAAVKKAAVVICRSGYSTLCDLAAAGAKALFVPTPGQTEQEYLAAFHAGKNHAAYQTQEQLQLEKGIAQAQTASGLFLPPDLRLLRERIEKL